MISKKIKVVLIDDSPIVLTILKRILSTSTDIEVIGTAKDGAEGLKVVNELNPDVVCTDLLMPVMDGLEFTKALMSTNPKPILVISIAVQKEDKTNVFNVLKAGALDVFPKPKGNQAADFEQVAPELINKIKIVNGVLVFKKKDPTLNLNFTSSFPSLDTPKTEISSFKSTYKMLAIGASTGGPPALQTILSDLPENFPVPIVCVQHISEGFIFGLVDWLDNLCKLKVEIAKEGEFPQAGKVYFPQEKKHLVLDANGRFVFSDELPYQGHKPAVNVTFDSFANYYKNSMLGVLLTGMGDDGAKGLKKIYDQGAYTIAQDEKSCAVFGMPRVAIQLGGAKEILSLNQISYRIKEILKIS
jgi:two-component system chemotaxis response regulator CheB